MRWFPRSRRPEKGLPGVCLSKDSTLGASSPKMKGERAQGFRGLRGARYRGSFAPCQAAVSRVTR